MDPITCFLLTPLSTGRRTLRRYSKSNDCRGDLPYHDAVVQVYAGELMEPGAFTCQERTVPRDDDRWPSLCDSCTYRFAPDDHWQEMLEREFRCPAGILTLREAGPGAMWWADWPVGGSEFHQARGGGPHLFCRTPGGDWDLDVPASNGPGWRWSGTPPIVTAEPSIRCNAYHGTLKAGVLRSA